jgi:hypothetical protein
MNRFANAANFEGASVEQILLQLRPWFRPVFIAATIVTILLMLIVATSKPAWLLLGAGRGFIPEGYYHLWGFVLLFGTLFGQAVGWAGGSAVGYYVMTVVGFPAGWTTARLAMSIVYLGLVVFPLSVYHHLYGGWLLNLPRAGLDEWLTANHPGARWLLISAHPIIDYSLFPLAVLFLGLLWWFGERVERNPLYQMIAALLVLLTSLAVALSLGIHSTVVHIRIGA